MKTFLLVLLALVAFLGAALLSRIGFQQEPPLQVMNGLLAAVIVFAGMKLLGR